MVKGGKMDRMLSLNFQRKGTKVAEGTQSSGCYKDEVLNGNFSFTSLLRTR